MTCVGPDAPAVILMARSMGTAVLSWLSVAAARTGDFGSTLTPAHPGTAAVVLAGNNSADVLPPAGITAVAFNDTAGASRGIPHEPSTETSNSPPGAMALNGG